MAHPAHGAMLCPACHVALVMSERQGVEIDYCPQCRGVWLDRGELDKIIDRQAGAAAPVQSYRPDRRDDDQYRSKPHKSHKSWLKDIFD